MAEVEEAAVKKGVGHREVVVAPGAEVKEAVAKEAEGGPRATRAPRGEAGTAAAAAAEGQRGDLLPLGSPVVAFLLH